MRTLAAAFVIVGLAGCGDSTGPGSVSGLYNLETVNGVRLPATASPNRRVTEGTMRIQAEGTWSMVFLFVFPDHPDDVLTVHDYGTWTTRAGATDLRLTSGRFSTNGVAPEYDADVSGRTVTLHHLQDNVLAFRR